MKYTGTLNKGITRRRFGLLADSDAHSREAKRVTDEMFAKLPELFAAHGVELGNWPALALALAKEHVPGFRLRDPAGRKTEWSELDKAELRFEVEETIANSAGRLTTSEAIKRVIRRDAWREKTKLTTLAALRKHFENADKRMIQIVKDARAYESIVRGN